MISTKTNPVAASLFSLLAVDDEQRNVLGGAATGFFFVNRQQAMTILAFTDVCCIAEDRLGLIAIGKQNDLWFIFREFTDGDKGYFSSARGLPERYIAIALAVRMINDIQLAHLHPSQGSAIPIAHHLELWRPRRWFISPEDYDAVEFFRCQSCARFDCDGRKCGNRKCGGLCCSCRHAALISREIKRTGISLKRRFEILKRDGFRCQYCGRGVPDVVLHVDHANPVCAKGTNDNDNLLTSCFDCNMGKGPRLINWTDGLLSAIV